MLRMLLFGCALALATPAPSSGQAVTAFHGRPDVKVSEGGTDRVVEAVSRTDAPNAECVISEIDGNFYWATRENLQMARVDGGAFTTFIALNGSGYVRVIKPGLKDAAALMGDSERRYDYVEHLLIGLASVTYYGRRR